MTQGLEPVAESQTETAAESTGFRFEVQQEFHEIPLGIGVDEDAFSEQMTKFSRGYWGEQEEREPIRMLTAALHGANSRNLAAEGAVYNALGVFPLVSSADNSGPPERVSRCTLLVSVRDLDNPDPALAAAGIAETLERSREGGEVKPIQLPAGPAVLHLTGTRSVWELPDGEQERFSIRMEIWLPFPEENRLLLVSLSTADVQDLNMYQAVLADIADTITFGEGVREGNDSRVQSVPASSDSNPFG
jgi:hypothetical protein